MAALDDSLSDAKTYSAWAGSTTDLLPILESIARQYENLRAEAVAEQMRHTLTMRELKAQNLARAESFLMRRIEAGETPRPEYADDVSRAREDLRVEDERLEAARAVAERVDDITINVVTRKGAERKTSGRPEEIIEYLAHKSIRELTLTAPAGRIPGHHLSLSFKRGEGVRLSVTARDSRWAVTALSEVGEAVENKVPSWAWLRSFWFLIPFFFGIGLVIVTSLTDGSVPNNDTPTLYVLSAVRGVLIGCVGFGAVVGTRFFVPAFELLPPGGKARVDRIVIAIGSGLLGLALSQLDRLIS